MSKAALIQLGEDAKAFTHVRKFSSILWETNKKQKTQATNPPTPLNSPLPEGYPPSSPDNSTEEGYFSDMEYFAIKQYDANDQLFKAKEYFEIKQYDTNDQLFKAKESPLSLYKWKLHNTQDRAKFASCGEFLPL